MVALFAFFAGFYYHLPIGYFLLGFLMLLLEGGSGDDKKTDSTGREEP